MLLMPESLRPATFAARDPIIVAHLEELAVPLTPLNAHADTTSEKEQATKASTSQLRIAHEDVVYTVAFERRVAATRRGRARQRVM